MLDRKHRGGGICLSDLAEIFPVFRDGARLVGERAKVMYLQDPRRGQTVALVAGGWSYGV